MNFVSKAASAALFACALTFSGTAQAKDGGLDRLVVDQSTVEVGSMSREKACLTEAVYFEAGHEPMEGRVAVAHVILNRTRSGTFPTSVCGVVNQKGQFTYRRGLGARRGDMKGWLEARAVATLALAGRVADVSRDALFFHALRSRPSWGGVRMVTRIGGHVFYAKR